MSKATPGVLPDTTCGGSVGLRQNWRISEQEAPLQDRYTGGHRGPPLHPNSLDSDINNHFQPLPPGGMLKRTLDIVNRKMMGDK